MATIKSLIDEFCDRINQPRGGTIVGSSQQAERQYLALFKFICDELLKYGAWNQLKRIYTFTAQTGVSNYQLPGDFFRSLSQTQFSVTNHLPLAGPLTDGNLAYRTYGIVPVTPYYGFQINGPQGYVYNTSPYTQVSAGFFQMSPAGQNNTDQQVIAYGSKNVIWPTSWVTAHAYTAGDKVAGIGSIFYATNTAVSGATRPDLANVSGGTVSDGAVTWRPYYEMYPPTADADFCLFDDELMIEGLRWAWYRSKKQDYSQERADWIAAVRTSLGRQNGVGTVDCGFNQEYWWDLPNVPIGSWNV